MRIDRLDLWRFGKFTDTTINFGEHQAGQPDLHIVYGPNEAGKSTLMAAYLDFLFGFHPKTPYNFKHANNVLKVGAVISIGEQATEYRRLKKNKDSLLDASDQPVSDSIIAQQLAGLGKESYATMFSLDDDTLEQGGESILASKGDLGKLLYSATTGVAQLSESLLQMREETDQFYKKGKRKFELAELKLQLKEIEAARKQLDTEASGYSKLVKQREEADKRYQSLGAEKDKQKLLITKLQLKKTAYPRLSSLNRLHDELKPLSGLPDVPAGWFEEVRALQKGSVVFNAREQDLTKKITTLDESIAAIKLDDAALGAQPKWQQIEAERDHYLVACTNLPEHQLQMRLCEHEISNCLRNLDQADVENPETLLLNASIRANLRELIQQQPSLQSQLATAKKECSAASNQNNECRERFLLAGGVIETKEGVDTIDRSRAPIHDLDRELSAYSNNDFVVQYRAKMQQIAELEDGLIIKLAQLSPWVGDGKALQLLSVPHESELQLLQRKRDQLNSRISEVEHSINVLNNTIEHTQSQKQSFSVTGLVDDAESSRLHRERDEAWVRHRKTLDEATADEFERTMRADDLSQSTRLQNTETLAQLGQMQRELFVAEDSITKARTQLEQFEAELGVVASELSLLVTSLSPALKPTMSIEAINGWLESRADALQDVQRQATLGRELADINEQILIACENLSGCLEATGAVTQNSTEQTNSVERLVSLQKQANATIKLESVLSGIRDQFVSSQHQLALRSTQVTDAENVLEQWTTSWEQLCSKCWFGLTNSAPSIAEVDGMLPHLASLDQLLTSQAGLLDKLMQYEGVAASFGDSLTALSDILTIATDNMPSDQLYLMLQTRMDQAVADRAELGAFQIQKNEALELQRLNAEKHTADVNSIERMSTHFSVQSIDEVELKLLEADNKAKLQQRIAAEQQELLDMLAVESLDQVVHMLSDFDNDKAQLALDELERAASDTDQQLQESHSQREQARVAVESVGGDEEVAVLAEKRANLLLDIEEKSTRYLQQHLALIAADSALKKYRDNHRSSMMKRASDAFSTISMGRYARLDTFQDGGSEKLIAIDKDGETKKSQELSKGTRFQLYLALRVAGYHEYVNSRPSVPFIADDIMETSDDERASRTFEVLGDMSRVGQVIYLTHHQHLCDIAKNIVPETNIHQLG